MDNTMLSSKIERIIQDGGLANLALLSSKRGVKSGFESAFTGSDLAGWVFEHLHADSSWEADHLVSLIYQLGYIVPLTFNKNITDPGSLIQFQTPYFWPSVNSKPDLIEYAIYLIKRSFRNNPIYWLDEQEQATLLKLQKIYCDKWDFIITQAQHRLKFLKQKTKFEKLVISSQEQTFWRTQCPVLEQVHTVDVIRRNSQIAFPNKKSPEGLRKEVKVLKGRLEVLKMKVSKVFESYVTYCELRADYDPFTETPSHSNPWISDDSATWSSDDGASKKRIMKWSLGIEELLKDPVGLEEFHSFLDAEFSSENINFWLAVKTLKCLPLSHVNSQANCIYQEYLTQGAPNEINVDCITKTSTVEQLSAPHRWMFDGAQSHVFMLMKKDIYPRFIRSERYKNLLEHPLTHGSSKKKVFSFNINPSSVKRSSAPRFRGEDDSDDDVSVNGQSSISHGSSNDSSRNGQELRDFPILTSALSMLSTAQRVTSDQTHVASFSVTSPRRVSGIGNNTDVAMETGTGTCNVITPWDDV